MNITKSDRLRQFNYYARDLLTGVKKYVDVSLGSKIDVILKDLSNDASVIGVNNFYHFICEDKELNENIKKKNVNFFVNYDKSSFSDKFGTDIFYDSIIVTIKKINDKDEFVKKVDDLRKITLAYNKL